MSQEPLPESAPSAHALHRKVLLGLLLGMVVYAIMILWADAGDMRVALRDFNPWLIPAAMGLSFLNYVVRFVRWERYRALLDIRMGRWTSFLIYLSGLALTVSPGKMGEALKSWLIRRVDGTPVHRSAPMVLAERLTDLLAFLILVAVGGLATQPEYAWIFWTTLALCALGLCVLCSERMGALACHLVARLPLVGPLAPRLEGAFASTRVLVTPRELWMPTLVATLGWSLECVALWLVANSLVGGGVELAFAVYAFALSAVAGAVLILFPGGLGITEGALSGLLGARYTALGVSAELARAKAASATIVIRLCTLWFAMGVGLVALGLFTRHHGALEKRAPG